MITQRSGLRNSVSPERGQGDDGPFASTNEAENRERQAATAVTTEAERHVVVDAQRSCAGCNPAAGAGRSETRAP